MPEDPRLERIEFSIERLHGVLMQLVSDGSIRPPVQSDSALMFVLEERIREAAIAFIRLPHIGGARPEHYRAAREALQQAVRDYAAAGFTEPLE